MANETEEQRNKRLQRVSTSQKVRLAKESRKQRRCRLKHMSDVQKERLHYETDEDRLFRLKRLSENQKYYLANEDFLQRMDRLANYHNFRYKKRTGQEPLYIPDTDDELDDYELDDAPGPAFSSEASPKQPSKRFRTNDGDEIELFHDRTYFIL